MSQSRDVSGQFTEKRSVDEVRATLDGANEPLTTAEIAEQLDISQRTALRRLNELSESDPTVYRKEVGANGVIWFIRHGAIHEQGFEEFAERAMEAHGDQIDEIILFGSVARGEAHEDSDVDVLVVVETLEIKDDLSEIAYEILHEYGVIITELIRTKEYIEENQDHPFLENVRREGHTYD